MKEHPIAPLRMDKVLAGVRNNRSVTKVEYVEQVDSTQNRAAEQIRNGSGAGLVFVAEYQTGGRGRSGRKWHSPPGTGLWLSLAIRPDLPVRRFPQLTFLTAVALTRVFHQWLRVDAKIKWPNDIYIGSRKVAGILLESVEFEGARYVIAGIGINVNLMLDQLPDELRNIATSLAIETGGTVSREELLIRVLNEWDRLYQLFIEQGFFPIRTFWEAHNMTLNRKVKVRTMTGVVEGFAEELDDTGALVLRLDDGSKFTVTTGDVEFVKDLA